MCINQAWIRKVVLGFISKVGVDRFAHFGLAGTLTAICGIFGYVPAVIAFVFVTVAGVMKEVSVDYKTDWWDFLAGEIGTVIAFAATLIKVFAL